MALCYAKSDKRGGVIESKEDKQGFGMTKRRKKRGAPRGPMAVLLNTLAHNVMIRARGWLSAEAAKPSR